ncbi:MAG: hypothetical protein ABIK62_05965 [candidate division WOR-3 bacterium]
MVRPWALLAARATPLTAGLTVDVTGGVYPGFEYRPSISSFTLMAAEAGISARVSSRTRDIVTAAIQLWAAPGLHDWTMGYHFGQAYVLVPLGLQLPTIKVGQGVIPFGLLSDYDMHTQIVQSLYPLTLGQRIDLGAGLQGSIAHTSYALWVANGTGPYRLDNDNNKVVTLRVAPKFLLGDAELTVGASGLVGRLPYWRLDSMMMQMAGPGQYRMRYRAALDNTTDWGPLTLRLEAVTGKDSALGGPLVYGLYSEARYAVTDWLEPMVVHHHYQVSGQGRHQALAAGLTFTPPHQSVVNVQAFYQTDWLDHRELHERTWNVATQLTVRF